MPLKISGHPRYALHKKPREAEVTKSIVKGIGFLSCISIGIGIAKTISKVLVLVLLKCSSSIGHNIPHRAL